MSDLLVKPNVSTKKENDPLYHTDINEITGSLGRTVDEVNKRMLSECNINIEELNNDFKKSLTLSEAISKVRPTRRIPGMIIKFLSSEKNGWVEYQYTSTERSDEKWNNLNNWQELNTTAIIDGGTF